MASVLLRRLRASGGEEAVAGVLARAGIPYTAEYLGDIDNWMSYEHAGELMQAAVELTGDEEVVRRVGEDTVRQHAGTAVATLLRSLGSPQAILEQVAVTVTKFSTVTAMEPVEVAPGHAVVRASVRPGYERPRHMCNWTTGLLSQV